MIKGFRAVFALLFVASLFGVNAAPAHALQCVPYAREISGIQLFGRAAAWWEEAAGKYDRGTTPKVGAVLAFASSRSMPAGHVAMVSQVISDREVLLTHANWSYHGGIEHDVRAIDVSEKGDWSQVRVWYGPIHDLGLRPNAAHGFIYTGAPAADQAPVVTAVAGTGADTGAAG